MMKENDRPNSDELNHLEQRITDLEERLSSIERDVTDPIFNKVGRSAARQMPGDESGHQKATPHEDAMESRIGEYGMAWLGNIVLLFGILYLSQYLQKNNQEIISLVFGIASIGIVYLIGHSTRTSLPYMSRLFAFNGHILLYLQAMRICIFQGSKFIDTPWLGHALILLVLASLIYLAYKNNSQILAVIAWLMVVVTALASGSTHFMLSLMLAIVGTAILFAIRKAWWTGLLISIFLVYFIYLNWILGNPVTSKSFAFISNHQTGHLYLFACALSYSLLALLPSSEKLSKNILHQSIVLNGLGFSLIFTVTVLAFFTASYYIFFGLIAAFCIAYSVWLQLRGTWKFLAALYAIYSFVALSISIAGIYQFPLAFFLLSIQSLLVVVVALWFRSRFMVIMNSILFVVLLIAYFVSGDTLDSINFSFALVALLTARILNWRKQRLEIRTELIRNIFLFTGAVMVLFSLQKAVPPNFVTLSWTIAALVFFILSVLIQNMKYRWLAIITMVVTVFYLFIVDLSNISLGYRIIALMFISAISLGISIFYSRRQKERKRDHA